MANDSYQHTERLYRLLPAVYRNRDNGDLARYLAACGELLDHVQQTLRQRLADNFPDDPPEGELACQEWLLPYFAQLLDVRLVSPHAEGRREEISQAVGWRQRKGTLACVEQIAEAVGQMEVEVQEAWRRVAVTPRIGMPLLPGEAHGYPSSPAQDPHSGQFVHADLGARHPGFPAASVDLRCPSRARVTPPTNPAARRTRFDDRWVYWRQASFHGVPCFAGSYEDVLRRTVDLRTPDWRVGHPHPRRLLLHTPPPAGYFPSDITDMPWAARNSEPFADLYEEFTEGEGVEAVQVFRNKTLDADTFIALRVPDAIVLGGSGRFRFEALVVDNTLTVQQGRLQLMACAVRDLVVESSIADVAVLDAGDCLFASVSVELGLARFEYCTVLQGTLTRSILASDSLFMDRVLANLAGDPPQQGCLRYSRIPKGQPSATLSLYRNSQGPVHLFADSFGQRGCGVLHPATAASVRFGAEDSGEMGAYHARRYSLQFEAVLDKLKDYLPVGVEAVLIPDTRLLEVPHEI